MVDQAAKAGGMRPGRVACAPDDRRVSIHSSISAKSQATFLLVSAMRRGNSPLCSKLKMVRSESGDHRQQPLAINERLALCLDFHTVAFIRLRMLIEECLIEPG